MKWLKSIFKEINEAGVLHIILSALIYIILLIVVILIILFKFRSTIFQKLGF